MPCASLRNVAGSIPACSAVFRERVRQSGDQMNRNERNRRADALLARKIQNVMQPHTLPSFEELELGCLTFQGTYPGGDLFDVLKISEDILALLMFGVQGSGMRSVLIAAMAKVRFTAHVHQSVSPAAVIERVNGELAQGVPLELHLSAFVGYLNLHDNLLTYCNAGGITPLVFRREAESVEYLHTNTRRIEPVATGNGGWQEERVHLAQGDCLLLHSDGFCNVVGTGSRADRSGVREILRHQIREAGCYSRFLDYLRAAVAQRSVPLDDDLSVAYAEILTQSRKNLLKEKLGFTHDDRVYLQFMNYIEEMDRVTATILTAMDVTGYSDERIRKMKIVLTELLVNAIIHGNNRDASKNVVIGHTIDRKTMVISIMDEGSGFDPSSIPDPTLPENLEKPCGRGLFIVRHYVDSIEFNETGNRVTISTSGTF